MGSSITEWKYSEKIEALRLLHTAHQISNGFYRLNGFLVVPSNYMEDSTHLVLFPDLPYNQIPKFWDSVKKIEIDDVPISAPEDLVSNVERLIFEEPFLHPSFAPMKDLWAAAEQDFLDAVGFVIPDLRGAVKKIYIYPTKNGTRASFNRVSDFPCDVHVHLRDDGDLYTLASAILISITRSKVYTKYKGLWSESQLLVDWLVEESPIHQALMKYQSARTSPHSMTTVRDYFDKKALEVSDEFYKKLGVERIKSNFEIENNTIKLDGKPMRELSPNEFKLMSLLIQNRREVVDTNVIADNLFSSDEEFSLYAIAKNVERLRKKLEHNGITGSYIKTVRGEGYMLR